MSKDPADIQHEARIVWTEDIDGFDYVRETLTTEAGTRARPVPWHGAGRRVGYSTLKRDAPNSDSPGQFTRRIFWVKEHDRSERPDGLQDRHSKRRRGPPNRHPRSLGRGHGTGLGWPTPWPLRHSDVRRTARNEGARTPDGPGWAVAIGSGLLQGDARC